MSQKKYCTTYVDVKFDFWSIARGFRAVWVLHPLNREFEIQQRLAICIVIVFTRFDFHLIQEWSVFNIEMIVFQYS